jgi:hypothetical protein
MRICRRLFVVVVADNDHGKSTAMNALLSQGLGGISPGRKGARLLTSPWGRTIDAYIFVRSFQEIEKKPHRTVQAALDHNDPMWRQRELIIFPSHSTNSHADIAEMIEAAHEAGFDAVCASLLIIGDTGDDRELFAPIWGMNWDERWTLPNPQTEYWSEQVKAIGRDLWAWICQAIAS